MLTRRRVLAASGVALASAAVGRRAFAQALTKPAHVIVGFPPGGATDVAARILADRLRGNYAPTVLVENKAGAAARLAGEYVKNAEPDGSVMLFTPDFPLSIYPHSFRSLNYDPLRDFIAVAPATKSMLTFNIGPAVPAAVKTLADFMQWAKANPSRAQFGTTAAGGSPHFVGVMLASEAGVPMTPVHYRGGAPALQDLLGGHIPASINPIAEALPQAQSGALRILGVTGSQRSRFAPDVPTMREQGFNVAIDSWLGVFVPAKTPADVVNALNIAIGEAARSPEMTTALEKFGNEPYFESPQQFAQTLKGAIERWGPVVKASGFVAEE